MICNMKICKGGKLKGSKYNKILKKNEEVDLTKDLILHLNDECDLEDNLILKDVLLLVKNHSDFLSPIVTSSESWLGELIEEGLNNPFEVSNDVHTLELKWCGNLNNWSGEEKLETYVHFEGLGVIPDDESYKDWPKDQPVNYAIDMSAINTLSELPIKLNKKMTVYDERNKKFNEVFLEVTADFSLLDVLKGIFWELSFHGSPKDRNVRVKELKQSIEDIESGKAKTIPWEELKLKKGEL